MTPQASAPLKTQHFWYAVRTRSNFEKIAATFLEAKGFKYFLPLYRTRKKWSDRVVESSAPLFPAYVFSKFCPRETSQILSTPGVVSIVSFAGKPAPITDEEIEAVERVLHCGKAAEPCSYLSEGQRIRINQGALCGVEGILLRKGNWRLVISIQLLQRSVAVEIDPDCISPV